MLPSSNEDRWILFLRLRGHLVLWTMGFFFKFSLTVVEITGGLAMTFWSGAVVGGGASPILVI